MTDENDLTDIIMKFQEYMEYDDLRYFTMISLLELLKSHSDVSKMAVNGQPYLCICVFTVYYILYL